MSKTQHILERASAQQRRRLARILRVESVGGLLLMGAAVLALAWANSPWASSYADLRDFRLGPAQWQLDLTLGQWSSDALLAVFFFLVGLELKRELVSGSLRKPATALVPVAAAVGGVVVPAGIYLAIVGFAGAEDALRGWAIPTATDIAFAVAVLAIVGSHLPSAMRIFLLTLAVVDDLIAIVIIAFVYAGDVDLVPLALAVIPIAVYALLARRFRPFFGVRQWPAWVILLPIGAVVWVLVHASGIHATIAGVVLGFTIPVTRLRGTGPGLAEILEHRIRPFSAGFAVPAFAFFAAGVTVSGELDVLSPVTLAIVAALIVGKPIGIVGTTWVMARFTRATLSPHHRWGDFVGVSLLAGIGFTVSLLIAELSFDGGVVYDEARIGVLAASLIASVLAAIVLLPRNRRYKRARRAGRAEN